MNEDTKRLLTEFLEEHLCGEDDNNIHPCCDVDEPWNCTILSNDGKWSDCKHKYIRTFSTESDLMALYRRIYETENWESFEGHMATMWANHPVGSGWFVPWLLCLSYKDYEKKCEIVARWIEEEK